MNSKSNTKTAKQVETAKEPTQQPENGKEKTTKANNLNLIAFKRIKGNAEQNATTYFLKACSNCNSKFATENRENETCSDECQNDNRIRGGGRFLTETNPSDIANSFDLEEYPKRNETQTIAQLKKEATQKILEEIKERQEKELKDKRIKCQADTKRKQKNKEKEIKKFLQSLPENLEEAIYKALQYNQTLPVGQETITVNSFEDEILCTIAEDTHENLIVTFPFDAITKEFIRKVKADIKLNSNQTTQEILENFEMIFYVDNCQLVINGMLQAKLYNPDEEEINLYTFLAYSEPYHNVQYSHL